MILAVVGAMVERRKLVAVGAIGTLLLLTVGAALARPGSLDASFGDRGRVVLNVGKTKTDTLFKAAALQANGKLVVADENGRLLRYDSSGRPDPTFGGGDGAAPAVFGAQDLEVLAGGRILVAGNGPVVARYDPDGTLDTSFADDGVADTGGVEDPFVPKRIVVQPDGKIVIGGVAQTYCFPKVGCSQALALARFNADGTLDQAFGGNGVVIANFEAANAGANSIALQDDGKIVAAGFWRQRGMVARYLPDGSVDSSFGDGGFAITSVDAQFADVAVRPNGMIVAGGSTGASPNEDFFLTRLSAEGVPDATFGNGGSVATDLGRSDLAHAMVIQANGRFLLAGESARSSGCSFSGSCRSDFALARYSSDGDLDPGFDADGTVTTSLGSPARSWSLVAQADGRIIAVGTVAGKRPLTNSAIVRYASAGQLDPAYGGGQGISRASHSVSSYDEADAVALQGRRLIVAGVTDAGRYDGSIGPALERLKSDGSLDRTFGSRGTARPPARFTVGVIDDLAVTKSGRIVVMNTPTGTIAAFRQDGGADKAFGRGGTLATGLVSGDLALRRNGKIVVSGLDVNTGQLVIAQYTPRGSPDRAFGDRGSFARDIGLYVSGVAGLALDRAGRILVAGHGQASDSTFEDPRAGFFVDRFRRDGRPDRTFSRNGVAFVRVAGSFAYAAAIAVQGDGRILVGGDTEAGPTVLRLRSGGAADRSFGGDGQVALKPDPTASYSVSLRHGLGVSRGRILVALGQPKAFHLEALNLSGGRDRGFGTGGVVTTRFPGAETLFTGGIALGSRRVVIGGTVYLTGSTGSGFIHGDLALARYSLNDR